MTRRSTLIAVTILAAALTIRVAQVQSTSYSATFDAGSYMSLASQVAHHGDYSNKNGAGGTRGPSAYFPPGFPYFLAAVDLLDGHTTRKGKAVHPARIAQAVLGTATVGLIGLLAFELFGATTALTAMALAAVYPVLIEESGILVAENLLTALMLAATWAVLRARRSPRRTAAWIAAAGLLTGLTALAHQNGVLLLIPLALALWQGRPRLRPGSLAAPALLVATTVLAIAPWTIRNAAEVHAFVPVSDENGITLIGTYNAASAANSQLPYKWRFYLGIPAERALGRRAGTLTEPQLGDRLQSQALSYIGHHPLAPLTVAFHNTLRLFELEGAYAWHASAQVQELPRSVAHTGVISFWILCGLALLGLLTRAARGAPRWLWAIPILFALSVVLVNVETPRFREPVEPFLILLAACALTGAARRLRPAPVRRHAGATVPGGSGELVEVVERLP